MGINYENIVKAEDSLAKIYINGEEFYGIGYQGLMTVNTKTYVNEPVRSNDGSISNIDDYETFIVPRCKINFKYFNIKDYMRLCRVLNSANQFPVKYFDKQFGRFVENMMYVEPEEMAKIYNVGTSVIGVIDYEVSFIGTLNNLQEFKVTYFPKYWDGYSFVNLAEKSMEYISSLTYAKGDKVKWNGDYYEAIYYENTFSGVQPPNSRYWVQKNYSAWNDVTTYIEGDVVSYSYVSNGNSVTKYYEAIKDVFYGRLPSNKEYWKEVKVDSYLATKTYTKDNYCFIESAGNKVMYKAIYYVDTFTGQSPINSQYWTKVNPQVNTEKKVAWGNSIKVLSSKDLSDFYTLPSGKKFKEWNTDIKGTGFKMLPNANWTVFEDTDVYPIFE